MSTNTWNLDAGHSGIGFSVRHLVFAKVRGRFSAWSGSLELDEENLAQSSVQVSIDAASIDTGTPDRDAHLRSPDFFDVANYPKLSFRSNRVEALGGDRYRVYGDLTIRDVTREVVLDSEFSGKAKDPWGNDRVAFTAKTSVDRRDFGLKWNQALETGGVVVGERVDIELEIQAVKGAATQAA
ncbi:MAG TPA: YceI family protein [Polyangiaceae bacterium]